MFHSEVSVIICYKEQVWPPIARGNTVVKEAGFFGQFWSENVSTNSVSHMRISRSEIKQFQVDSDIILFGIRRNKGVS